MGTAEDFVALRLRIVTALTFLTTRASGDIEAVVELLDDLSGFEEMDAAARIEQETLRSAGKVLRDLQAGLKDFGLAGKP